MTGELKGVAEPALVLTPPDEGSEADDSLLTASEIATLKLDADWVILSACNTAATGIAKHSRVNSSITVGMRNALPSWIRSMTKS